MVTYGPPTSGLIPSDPGRKSSSLVSPIRKADFSWVQLGSYPNKSNRVPKRLTRPGNVGRDLNHQRLHQSQASGATLLGEAVQHPFADFLRPRVLPRGGRRCLDRSLAARAAKAADRPTMRSCPSTGKPTTAARGCAMGPMTAARTTSMTFLLLTFSQIRRGS